MEYGKSKRTNCNKKFRRSNSDKQLLFVSQSITFRPILSLSSEAYNKVKQHKVFQSMFRKENYLDHSSMKIYRSF